MALVTLRQPFDRFRGALMDVGGSGIVVYDSLKAGQVARRFVSPHNPKSANQETVRTYLTAAAQAYRALSATVAANWNAAAVLVKKKNNLAVDYEYSGINLFCEVNFYRQLDGQAITPTPPVKTELPVIAAAAITATISATPSSTLTVGVTNSLSPGSDTFHALVLCSPPWVRPARLPRRNDYAMRDHATPAHNIYALPGTSAVNVALVNTLLTFKTADVVKIFVRPISADYVPGIVTVTTSVTIAAP
jgi:hypothetical protein